jgi:hypothetical protein
MKTGSQREFQRNARIQLSPSLWNSPGVTLSPYSNVGAGKSATALPYAAAHSFASARQPNSNVDSSASASPRA